MLDPTPGPVETWGQTRWWWGYATTIAFPFIQRKFVQITGAVELPEKGSTRRERFWFRTMNIIAGNTSRNDALDEAMKKWNP